MRRAAAARLMAVLLLAGATSAAPAEAESRAVQAGSGRIVAVAGRPLLVTGCHRDANDYGQGPGIETDPDGDDNAAYGREQGRGRAPEGRPVPCEHDWRH